MFTGLLDSVGETKARRGMFMVHGGNKEPGLPTVCVLTRVCSPTPRTVAHRRCSYIFL